MNNKNPLQQITINTDMLEDVFCSNCQSKIFEKKVIIKRVSPLVSPTGKEEFLFFEVLMCVKCETIKELQDNLK